MEIDMVTNVTAPAPFVRDPASGPSHQVLGVTHVYKATGAETAGAFSLWETVIPPGGGAPPHTHAHEDESFYVLSGEVLVDAEGEPARAASRAALSSSAPAAGAMVSAMSATCRPASSC
jgi:uncharacterized cupin superfamily protein